MVNICKMAVVGSKEQVMERIALDDNEKRLKLLFRAQQEAWKRLSDLPIPRAGGLSLPPAAGERPQYELVTEELVKEWLVKQPCLSTRLFLVERLLPTLVLGLEKLLVEVGRKGLVGATAPRPSDFNPINYLAQFLMRNNPNFKRQASSLYTQRLTDIADELRRTAMGVDESKKDKVKEMLLEKKQQKEREVAAKAAEEAERERLMAEVGDTWDSGEGISAIQVLSPALLYHYVYIFLVSCNKP